MFDALTAEETYSQDIAVLRVKFYKLKMCFKLKNQDLIILKYRLKETAIIEKSD